jgi:two-component system sensor histidine kinase BarA
MKQWRIKNRILFLALLPGVLATLALGLFFIHERWQDLDDLLESRTLTLAKHLAPTCEYGVITGNNGILQNIANSMLEEQDVRSVSIFNKDLEQLAHAGPLMLTSRQTAHDLQNGQLYLLRTSDSIRVRTPILAQNLLISDELSGSFSHKSDAQQKVLGWVEVELSMNNTRLLRYQHLASALGIILLVLLFSSLVAIRTSRNITVPVSQLIRALRNLEFGKLSTRVSIRTGGELGQLCHGQRAGAHTFGISKQLKTSHTRLARHAGRNGNTQQRTANWPPRSVGSQYDEIGVFGQRQPRNPYTVKRHYWF